MTTRNRFQLSFDGRAYTVTVDGQDVSEYVAAVDVHAAPHDLPRVVLHLRPTGAWPTSLDLLAQVEIGVPRDPGPDAVSFLEALDPLEVEPQLWPGWTWRTYRAAVRRPYYVSSRSGPVALDLSGVRRVVEGLLDDELQLWRDADGASDDVLDEESGALKPGGAAPVLLWTGAGAIVRPGQLTLTTVPRCRCRTTTHVHRLSSAAPPNRAVGGAALLRGQGVRTGEWDR